MNCRNYNSCLHSNHENDVILQNGITLHWFALILRIILIFSLGQNHSIDHIAVLADNNYKLDIQIAFSNPDAKCNALHVYSKCNVIKHSNIFHMLWSKVNILKAIALSLNSKCTACLWPPSIHYMNACLCTLSLFRN